VEFSATESAHPSEARVVFLPTKPEALVIHSGACVQVARYQLTVFTVLIGLLDIFALFICVGQADKMRQRSVLRQGGADVIGKITQLGRAGKGAEFVRYTFIANGGIVSGGSAVPPKLMHGLRESNSLRIRYLPSDPVINHPAAWEWSLAEETGSIFVSISLGAILLVIFLMLNWALFNTLYQLYRRRH
jgi:hypothetical protein